MNILLTGGTGLIGRALCRALLHDGHHLSVLSRQPAKVAALCGETVTPLATLDAWPASQRVDAVINLAGAPIVDWPWTAARKRLLWASRVSLTEALIGAIGRAQDKPAVLLSGSAIGYYGNQPEALCSDADPQMRPAGDYGAQLCAAWEDAARAAQRHGVRVCLLRTGLVLAPDGGLFKKLRTPFSLGLGARLGNGQQWMSWIHIDDYVAAVRTLLQHSAADGAFNMTAPAPVRNADFTVALADALHRPALLAAPACVLRAALGQRADFLLGGQNVPPARLLALGQHFRHATLESALAALV